MRKAESSQGAKIPFKKINLGEALKRIAPLIETGYIGLGNVVFETEKKLAEYVGAKEVVLVDSCTSALFLSLKYEKQNYGLISPRTKVSIPSMTVPLAANAVLESGYELEFDDRTSWVGTKYLMLGTGVIDSAHELRRDSYKNLRTKEGYSERLKLCFSFYPTKTIGSADGGAIATDDVEFARWARSAATYGRNQGTKYQNSWDYDVEMIGYKRHYTNLQAAIVLEQLERLDYTNAKRQKIVQQYNDAFGLENDSDYLYRMVMPRRDEFIEYMLRQGIECGVHFKPLHKMKPFLNFSVQNAEEIEKAYAETVSLPLYDLMTEEEVKIVIERTLAFRDELPL